MFSLLPVRPPRKNHGTPDWNELVCAPDHPEDSEGCIDRYIVFHHAYVVIFEYFIDYL